MLASENSREAPGLPEAAGRVFCYIFGPLSAAVMLAWRQSSAVWSIRFHAFHSLLMTALWAAMWGALRGLEEVFPWFLSMSMRQIRFAMNLGFVLIWAFLLVTAYGGGRCATVPFVHSLAVRLARRFRA